MSVLDSANQTNTTQITHGEYLKAYGFKNFPGTDTYMRQHGRMNGIPVFTVASLKGNHINYYHGGPGIKYKDRQAFSVDEVIQNIQQEIGIKLNWQQS